MLAKREYEAWFIAAAESLHGQRGFLFDPRQQVEPEIPRNAKEWMGKRMKEGVYRPATDQPAFTARMSLQQARDGSRSFRKLCSEWSKQMAL